MIYLDYNATTPLDPEVWEAMQPWFTARFGNAASVQHAPGRQAAAAVEEAAAAVAELLGADPREIYWTSGATESVNLAIFGVAASPAYKKRRHLVCVRTEHRAVLDSIRHLEEQGFEVTWLGVDSLGHLDLEELSAALRDDTLLVSVMHGNNEIGTVHDLAAIGSLVRERGALLHVDAAQTFGKLPLDVEAMAVDLLSFSGHKIYGPKGVGGLFVRRRGPRVRCEPQIFGGGHQKGLRSGTLNVPAIVGLGAAARRAIACMATDGQRILALRQRLLDGLAALQVHVSVNGDSASGLPGTLNLCFAGQDAEAMLAAMPDLAMSTASACASASLQPSYVLRAIGCDEEQVRGSLRCSIGRFTTEQEADQAVGMMAEAIVEGT